MDARDADEGQCSHLMSVYSSVPASDMCLGGASCVSARSDEGVARRTAVGLPDFAKVRYSSTGRHGDELNTGCGAAW